MRLNKENLRRNFLSRRNSLKDDEIEEKSKKIAEKLFSLTQFRKAEKIMFYASFKSEVKTFEMIKKAQALGKKVVLPVIVKERKELVPYLIKDPNKDLKPGPYGIPEPDIKKTEKVNEKEIELVVVPGVAFDTRGRRIGYGEGYYDRFLKKLSPQALKVGLCFEVQLAKEIPAKKSDIKMDFIISEEKIIQIKNQPP